MSDKELENRLVKARTEAKLTQSVLADKMELKPASIWRWEKGIIQPKDHRLRKIAEITGVSFEWLKNGEMPDDATSISNDGVISANASTIAHLPPSAISSIKPQSVKSKIIAYQGRPGAYSHLACISRYPEFEPRPYSSFEDCFKAVENGEAGLAMIPIENSLGGRVADIHLILPDSNLYIVDEHFQPVQHMLWGQPNANLSDIKKVMSHEQALSQCRATLQSIGAEPVVFPDTAGACEYVASKNDKSLAALGSVLAGKVYGLQNLRYNMEDKLGNVTRFIVMSRVRIEPDVLEENSITSFIFTLRSIPAALYKCMGGFATNSVNFIKLESYISIADHNTASFYAEIEGHPADKAVERAFHELHYFTSKVKIIGTFPANPKR